MYGIDDLLTFDLGVLMNVGYINDKYMYEQASFFKDTMPLLQQLL